MISYYIERMAVQMDPIQQTTPLQTSPVPIIHKARNSTRSCHVHAATAWTAYYSNYNVNQPRHFCNCQRYWTAGGIMRNVPVGAGLRKNKTSASNHYHQLTVPESDPDLNSGFPTKVPCIPGSHWPWPPVAVVPTPSYRVPSSSPTLGKRLGGKAGSTMNEVLMSKTLRIYDTKEAAKCSI